MTNKVVFDITHRLYQAQSASHPWAVETGFWNSIFNTFRDQPSISWRMVGEVGDWLRTRGHTGRVSAVEIPRGQHVPIVLCFDDPDLALLFKLTWL